MVIKNWEQVGAFTLRSDYTWNATLLALISSVILQTFLFVIGYLKKIGLSKTGQDLAKGM